MMSLWKQTLALTLVSTLTVVISGNQNRGNQAAEGDPDLAKKIRRFAPTTLTANTSRLSPNDRKALDKIIAAAKFMDPLFLRQVWSGNAALQKKLETDKSPVGQQCLHYFL